MLATVLAAAPAGAQDSGGTPSVQGNEGVVDGFNNDQQGGEGEQQQGGGGGSTLTDEEQQALAAGTAAICAGMLVAGAIFLGGGDPAAGCAEAGDEALPAISVYVLRDRAQARVVVPDPVPGSNPPFDEPGRFGVVGIPTWLWIDGPWAPIGPITESSGTVTVAVMASPQQVTWNPGDGGAPIVCDGPGEPWTLGADESSSSCSHVYTSSSADLPGASYSASATVQWSFEWWLNGVAQGEFGTYLAETTFTYQVGEIQAIES
jgi:hypothetical protein